MKAKDILTVFETMIEAFGREALVVDVIEEGGLEGAKKVLEEQNSETITEAVSEEVIETPTEIDDIISGIMKLINSKVTLSMETGNMDLLMEAKGLTEAIQIIKANTSKAN